MNGAIEKGLEFLFSRQAAEGYWEDWDLPVGASRLWTTAYVGWRLASSGLAATSACKRAADWLIANELDGGGWGYAISTGADADSTALGILFLSAMGRTVPADALRRLLGFRRNDGGFGTYGFDQSFGAWTASQTEVTATAALALQATGVRPDVVERAAAYLRERRRPDGLWDSYWWTSACYATDVVVRLLGDTIRREVHPALYAMRPANPFNAALRSMVVGTCGGEVGFAQDADGGWPSAPILRLTHRDVYVPQDSVDAGPCYADIQRVFTTATVISALAALT